MVPVRSPAWTCKQNFLSVTSIKMDLNDASSVSAIEKLPEEGQPSSISISMHTGTGQHCAAHPYCCPPLLACLLRDAGCLQLVVCCWRLVIAAI